MADGAVTSMNVLAQRLTVAVLLAALAAPAAAEQCSLSITPLAFGPYDPFGPPRDATGSVRVQCNGNANALVMLGGGAGDPTDREMRAGSESLRYGVYSDAARTQHFSFATAGKGDLTIPLHGRIPAGQGVGPGVYQDTLIVTLTF